jgi:hypothetical protein
VVDMGDDGKIAELGEVGGHCAGRLAGWGAGGKGCGVVKGPTRKAGRRLGHDDVH